MDVLQISPAILKTYKKYIANANSFRSHNDFQTQDVVLKEGEGVNLRQYDKTIYLEPTEETGILLIETDESNITRFLFDGPICVKENVWFCVMMYNTTLSYQQFAPLECKVREALGNNYMLAIKPNFHISNIYSVLYQTRWSKERERNFKHSYWELTYVDYGTIICEVDKKLYTLNKDDIMFFTSNQLHKVKNISNQPASYFTITFDINTEGADFEVLGNRILHGDAVIRRLIKEMLSEYNLSLAFFYEVIAAELLRLIVHIYRLTQTSFSKKTIITNENMDVQDPLIRHCLQIIEENLPSKVSAEFIASKLFISSTHLRKLFKEELDISISEYIRNRKLEQAKQMMLNKKYTITQISDMLEFCSVCYFSSEFKNKFGVQPKEYEKSIGRVLKK